MLECLKFSTCHPAYGPVCACKYQERKYLWVILNKNNAEMSFVIDLYLCQLTSGVSTPNVSFIITQQFCRNLSVWQHDAAHLTSYSGRVFDLSELTLRKPLGFSCLGMSSIFGAHLLGTELPGELWSVLFIFCGVKPRSQKSFNRRLNETFWIHSPQSDTFSCGLNEVSVTHLTGILIFV